MWWTLRVDDDQPGRLVLAGAPLGNAGDASTRLREVRASADVVAAEDTRRLLRLARDLDITVGGVAERRPGQHDPSAVRSHRQSSSHSRNAASGDRNARRRPTIAG